MIQKIKGTMDILPEKTPLFRYIEGIMREEAAKRLGLEHESSIDTGKISK